MPLTCRVSSVGARNKAGDHEYLQENINLKQNNKLKRASQAALMVKNPPANADYVRDPGLIPGWGRCPGEGGSSISHSSILAWGIPSTKEPGGLQSIGSQRGGHD